MTICCNNSEFFLVKYLFSCSLPKQDNLLYKDKRPVDMLDVLWYCVLLAKKVSVRFFSRRR